MKHVWVTRASPGAEVTAERVRALGLEPIVAPVLATRRIDTVIDLAAVGALAFTSANAVRAYSAMRPERDLPVFAIGDATAEAARTAGFAAVRSADGDVTALAALIAGGPHTFNGEILHPGAAEPAGDLVGALARAGYLARAVTIYETVAAEIPREILTDLDVIDVVLVHSPKAGRRVADILAGRDVSHLLAFCLSTSTADALNGLALAAVVAAPMPREDALLSLLARLGAH